VISVKARIYLEWSSWTFGILKPRQTICHTHTHTHTQQTHTLTASLSSCSAAVFCL